MTRSCQYELLRRVRIGTDGRYKHLPKQSDISEIEIDVTVACTEAEY